MMLQLNCINWSILRSAPFSSRLINFHWHFPSALFREPGGRGPLSGRALIIYCMFTLHSSACGMWNAWGCGCGCGMTNCRMPIHPRTDFSALPHKLLLRLMQIKVHKDADDWKLHAHKCKFAYFMRCSCFGQWGKSNLYSRRQLHDAVHSGLNLEKSTLN